jgi:transcriptional regulator GlxA family with amidase domain
MARSETIFASTTEPLTTAVLILPHSSILEVASVLDPMRAANRHLAQEAYRWRILSPGGAPVPLTCGFALPSSGDLEAAIGADALIVIAGYRLAEVATRRKRAAVLPVFPILRGIGRATSHAGRACGRATAGALGWA